MKIKVTGTYRERLRIWLLLGWIVGPWKTRKINESWSVPMMGHIFASGPVTFEVKLDAGGLLVDVRFAGFQIWRKQFVVQGGAVRIHAEPIKGCILDVLVEVI